MKIHTATVNWPIPGIMKSKAPKTAITPAVVATANRTPLIAPERSSTSLSSLGMF
jgi:hypothetical protein